MYKTLRALSGLAVMGSLALAVQPAFAEDKAENQLVGIKLWRGFKDVLAKHGQPTRIEIGAVTAPGGGGGGMAGGAEAGGMTMGSGMMMGRGMSSGMAPGSSGMMGGGKMGMMMAGAGGGSRMGMAGGGSGSLPGLAGGGGMMGNSGSAMMGMMGRGRRGPMGEDGEMGAPTGPPAGMMGSGGMAGFGLAGGGGMGGDNGAGGGSEGEVTWVYDRPGGLTYMFLFNKDGRVIQIQEYGYKGGGPTGRGVTLGDPVSKVYAIYGWANTSSKNGNQLTLDFSQKHHVAFQLLDQGKGPKVIGITLAITERGQIPGQ